VPDTAEWERERAMAPDVMASYSHAYNVFRRTTEPELLCVVRSDYAVPTFIRRGEWEFVETPVRFSTATADESMRYNGFYLFLALAVPCRAECRLRLAA
jgi:hypothetical protein